MYLENRRSSRTPFETHTPPTHTTHHPHPTHPHTHPTNTPTSTPHTNGVYLAINCWLPYLIVYIKYVGNCGPWAVVVRGHHSTHTPHTHTPTSTPHTNGVYLAINCRLPFDSLYKICWQLWTLIFVCKEWIKSGCRLRVNYYICLQLWTMLSLNIKYSVSFLCKM